jgi:hypothetical protein
VILIVVFVVLMLMWLFGGGYGAYQGDKFNFPSFGSGTLIPWICVAILGWYLFSGTPVVPVR